MTKHFGKFSIRVENKKTKKVRSYPVQDNLILNSFFGSAAKYGFMRSLYCLFGTGSKPPLVTDVSLENKLPGSAQTVDDYFRGVTINVEKNSSEFKREAIVPLAAAQGAIVGNISEIGLSYSSSESLLFTRALIKDEMGNPTTISVGANDIISVEYIIGYTIDLTTPLISTKTIDVGGVSTEVKLYWCGYSGAYGIYSLWNDNSPHYTKEHPFYPTSFAKNITPYSGVIADFSDLSTSSLTLLGPPKPDSVYGYGYSDGTMIGRQRSDQVFSENICTGSWDGLLITSDASSSTVMMAMTFNPPIVKTATDVFTIDSLILGSLRL